MRKEIDSRLYESQKLKEERARDSNELERLKELNSIRIRENQNQDSRIQAVDYELYKA